MCIIEKNSVKLENLKVSTSAWYWVYWGIFFLVIEEPFKPNVTHKVVVTTKPVNKTCTQHGIKGFVYNISKGIGSCPDSTAEYGDKCVITSTEGELDGKYFLWLH